MTRPALAVPMIPQVRPDRLLAAAAELFLGARCAGCGAPGWTPCARCLAALRASALVAPRVPLDLPVVSAGEYDGVTQTLIIAAKERGSLALVPVLGRRLAVAVAALWVAAGSPGPAVLVPVPSPWGRVADRGLDFTTALARAAATELRRGGLAVSVRRVFRLHRRPADQSGLGVADRQRNLVGAFVATSRLPEGGVVVVDDIVTTGASLAEAVRALRASGREPIGAASVAATMRRGGARTNRTPPPA